MEPSSDPIRSNQPSESFCVFYLGPIGPNFSACFFATVNSWRGEESGSIPTDLIGISLTQVGGCQKDLPVVPGPFQRLSLFSFTWFFSINEVAQVPQVLLPPVPARGLSLSPPLILGIWTVALPKEMPL